MMFSEVSIADAWDMEIPV